MKKLAVILALLLLTSSLGFSQTATKYTGAQHGVSVSFPALAATGSTAWAWVGDTVPTKHAIQLNCTGGPTITGNLEGSLDGVTASTVVAASATCGTTVWESTGAKPILWVRVSITVSGGASPTVTPLYAGSN
jgi:hypothetical protein